MKKKYRIIIMDVNTYQKLRVIPIARECRQDAIKDLYDINRQFKADPYNTSAAMLV